MGSQFSRRYWAAADRAGRRPRRWLSLAGVLACLAGLAAASWSVVSGYNPPWLQACLWLAVAVMAVRLVRGRDRR